MNTHLGTAEVVTLLLVSAFTGCATRQDPSRVKQRQTPLAITNVKNGQTLSGALPLQVRLSSNRHEYGDIELLIDGARAGEAGDNIQPSGGSFTTSIPIETDTYPNGWHYLTVQTADQPQARYHVKFWNDVSEFSVDGLADPGARIRARSAPGGLWTVTIAAAVNSDTVVRVYHGHGKAINILWDCKNAQGRTVPDDAYQVTLMMGKTPPLTSLINKMQ